MGVATRPRKQQTMIKRAMKAAGAVLSTQAACQPSTDQPQSQAGSVLATFQRREAEVRPWESLAIMKELSCIPAILSHLRKEGFKLELLRSKSSRFTMNLQTLLVNLLKVQKLSISRIRKHKRPFNWKRELLHICKRTLTTSCSRLMSLRMKIMSWKRACNMQD